MNPDEGFIVTANDFWSTHLQPVVITAHMGAYRSDRIKQLLRAKEKISIEDCERIHGGILESVI
jgi:hypothetical protein